MNTYYTLSVTVSWLASRAPNWFLPRCMECRRGVAMRILSVCLSVCPSVCQTRALWQNGRKLCLDCYIIQKNIHPRFLRRRIVVGGDTFYLKFLVKLAKNASVTVFLLLYITSDHMIFRYPMFVASPFSTIQHPSPDKPMAFWALWAYQVKCDPRCISG